MHGMKARMPTPKKRVVTLETILGQLKAGDPENALCDMLEIMDWHKRIEYTASKMKESKLKTYSSAIKELDLGVKAFLKGDISYAKDWAETDRNSGNAFAITRRWLATDMIHNRATDSFYVLRAIAEDEFINYITMKRDDSKASAKIGAYVAELANMMWSKHPAIKVLFG
jgi:hypothetical protein